MLWGKECSVHMGACFSGGSRLAPAGETSRHLLGACQPPKRHHPPGPALADLACPAAPHAGRQSKA